MKLSNREKIMIVIAIVSLVGIGLYLYVVTPIHDENKLALEELNTVESQYNLAQSQVKSQTEMDGYVALYRDLIDGLEGELPSIIHLEEMIDLMFNHFEAYDIVVDNISFTDTNGMNMVDTDYEDGNIQQMSVDEILTSYEKNGKISIPINTENASSDEITYNNINYMSITLNFVSNYDVLKETLEKIQEFDNTAVITNLTLAKNSYVLTEEDGDIIDSNLLSDEIDFNEVTVTLSLSIPYYYDYEKNKEFIFDYPYETEGEAKPFDYEIIEEPVKKVIDSNENSSSGANGNVTTPAKLFSHFNIYLNPSSSDQPAQSLAYFDMSNSKLVLDSNINEQYILNLTEENDIIYYSFSNDNESFPGGNAKMILNDIDETINIKVLSSTRVSSDDLSGMILKINNDTSKQVNIHVYYDDKNNPRLSIIREKGLFEKIIH